MSPCEWYDRDKWQLLEVLLMDKEFADGRSLGQGKVLCFFVCGFKMKDGGAVLT